jgi:hypothetical protein
MVFIASLFRRDARRGGGTGAMARRPGPLARARESGGHVVTARLLARL